MTVRNFSKEFDLSMIAFKNGSYDVKQCFVEINKTLIMPNEDVKSVVDYQLNRYTCYLIVQNGDSRKESNGETL